MTMAGPRIARSNIRPPDTAKPYFIISALSAPPSLALRQRTYVDKAHA
jgi:hypothetical protein